MTGFCRMNYAESICRSHREKISCFKNGIPPQFESTGDSDIDCSFIFPPGYSIYVEEFIFLNDDPGPDNFILLDDEKLQYHSELKWEFRRQNFWDTLEKGHPLRENSIRRANYQCVDTLKVKHKGIRTHPYLQKQSLYKIIVFSLLLNPNLLSKVHAKKIKFSMKIQITPYCEDERNETAVQDQFYVETDFK